MTKKKYGDIFQNKPINLRIGIKINLKDRGEKIVCPKVLNSC